MLKKVNVGQIFVCLTFFTYLCSQKKVIKLMDKYKDINVYNIGEIIEMVLS